jgi:hypothetical protein
MTLKNAILYVVRNEAGLRTYFDHPALKSGSMGWRSSGTAGHRKAARQIVQGLHSSADPIESREYMAI